MYISISLSLYIYIYTFFTYTCEYIHMYYVYRYNHIISSKWMLIGYETIMAYRTPWQNWDQRHLNGLLTFATWISDQGPSPRTFASGEVGPGMFSAQVWHVCEQIWSYMELWNI